jgi:hypothetical protein
LAVHLKHSAKRQLGLNVMISNLAYDL